MMACYVSQPNSVVLDIAVNPKDKGQQCLDQVCERLKIIEQDYFGLQYSSHGKQLWLNMRNRLDRQLNGSTPYRLQLKVKFFVAPHQLLQPATRALFYDQVKEELKCMKLVIESVEQVIDMTALMAQADFGDYSRKTHQMNQYKMLLIGIWDTTLGTVSNLIKQIAKKHSQCVGMTKESAQYKFLQCASELRNYGVEYHDATWCGELVNIGLGPSGVIIYNKDFEQIERLAYPMITKAEHIGRKCALRIVSDNGMEREIVWLLPTSPAGNALYRCVTEMHSFFCCDTVHNEISEQFSRDLKGTLAALFNENTTLGRDFVFDIKRTSREAHDHARRLLYQPIRTAPPVPTPMLYELSEYEESDSVKQRCQELEDRMKCIQESFTCCVCRDAEISAALCPCGHLTCHDCAEKLSQCPLCREVIDSIQRIFMPTNKKEQSVDSASSVTLKPTRITRSTSRHKLCDTPMEESMDTVYL